MVRDTFVETYCLQQELVTSTKIKDLSMLYQDEDQKLPWFSSQVPRMFAFYNAMIKNFRSMQEKKQDTKFITTKALTLI